MTMRRLMAALVLLVGASSASGQAATRSGDPITGTWVGDMGRDATARVRVNIDLKLDGRTFSGVVTGPALTPGDITGGTWDPATGAVNFLVVVRDGETRVRFEGALARDTIAGHVSSENVAGTFSIAKGAAAAAGATAAALRPSTAADSALAAVRVGFTQVNDWLTRAMATVPADRYSYRPGGTVRTFGQIVAHIADSYNYYCGRAVTGRDTPWSDVIEKGPTDRGTLTQKLRAAIDVCNGAYADGAIGPLMENVAHTNLHYGNLVTYMRMLGLTPPSS